jgi:hypothetical protein
MLQTSRPERTRSLVTPHLKAGYEDFRVQAGPHFSSVGSLQEQPHRFLQILSRLFNRPPLAGNVEFGAQGNITIAFSLDNGRELMRALHVAIVRQFAGSDLCRLAQAIEN